MVENPQMWQIIFLPVKCINHKYRVVEVSVVDRDMCKWKIYIVTHQKIYPALFQVDTKFNNQNYCFLNVGSTPKLENSEEFSCIAQRDLPNYVALGKYWTESEGIYNIWRSGIYKELDFIGFLHYDKELRLIKGFGNKTNITERIEKYLYNKDRAHISFECHSTRWDYAQNFMADTSRPNEPQGDGVNCYSYILADYNEFFHTNYTVKDLLRHRYINLCSCFLIDIKTFDKMMQFFDWIVQSHRLEVFDTEHKHRFQGILAERYFGIFLLLEYKEYKNLSIVHQYDRGLK